MAYAVGGGRLVLGKSHKIYTVNCEGLVRAAQTLALPTRISKHVGKKLARYLEARAQLPGYENAPIGFRFTEATTPEFRAAVESRLDQLRAANPGVEIRAEWAK